MRLLISAGILICTNTLLAQEKTITGKITDATNGQPIVGATVAAKDASVATQTNSEGNFSLSVPAGTQRLVISSVGYTTKEVAITSENTINVTLNVVTGELGEVVVTALGIERQRKSLQFSATQVPGDR